MKTKLFTLITLTATLLLTLATSVQAQSGNPLIPLDEYGVPDMELIDLIASGGYTECAMCISLPIIGETGIVLSYDIYTDNFGNTWVVPDPFTVIYTAIYPESIPEGLAANAPGFAYGSMLMGIVEAAGGFEALGIDLSGVTIDTDQDLVGFFQDFLEMEGDHLEFMLEMWQTLDGMGSLPLWQLSWVYADDR